MALTNLDWFIVVAFLLLTLLIGLYASKKSGKNTKEFFLSGNDMPWWMLGISMVATTFSADTPNLVTDIVRKNGVSGNWVWWAFCLTGMLTVFVYARLWRRSGIMTDLEFYEIRYSGKPALFLRAFRAIYLGVFCNVLIMATVLLAGIKIGGILLGISPIQTVIFVSLVTVFYAALGGLRGVILTDFFQFILSMIGLVLAAIYIVQLPEIGGIEALINHPDVEIKKSFLPDFSDSSTLIPLFIVPLAIQWWSVWYPGSEPGGGGYIAQRMLSAKNEEGAVKATLLFNIAHYALRPWPWILIALASIIVFPDLESIALRFPALDQSKIDDDAAFSAMLTYLPSGLLGLILASLMAALMSTISTHLNWGSSYIIHDVYQRLSKDHPSEKMLVRYSRWSTIILMLLAAVVALYLSNALSAFNILLQIGAGTGLIFILRWFWWRINAYSEITAMVVSFIIACYMEFVIGDAWLDHHKLITGVTISTIAWLLVTFLTRPTDSNVLASFFKKTLPHGFGWKKVIDQDLYDLSLRQNTSLGKSIGAMLGACFMVYFVIFGVGYLLYGQYLIGFILLLLSTGIFGVLIMKVIK